jgi:hypothetical protein
MRKHASDTPLAQHEEDACPHQSGVGMGKSRDEFVLRSVAGIPIRYKRVQKLFDHDFCTYSDNETLSLCYTTFLEPFD